MTWANSGKPERLAQEKAQEMPQGKVQVLAQEMLPQRPCATEQQRRLGELGVKKAVRAGKAAAKTAAASGPRAGGEAFQTGVQALALYIEREGGLPRRAVVELRPDGSERRPGIWIGNQKARRDRPHAEQLAALAELGVKGAR
ncbi:hypothetical protein NFX46_18785 [Streptomyces phaeoluteigriseus]|uniref:Helicase-associated domain-containing protein n=1 Tax=Streptomyces phaeoluteigriseus TaxID=114686 RepID=A0ABY4Z998_9ACTN|nr:hypothetical protein [Streptomyces phaeoluteigriseus]USQ85627.1 hypothetical protein NFX46_18785 [Streptomyces phaeoluteigriseus]